MAQLWPAFVTAGVGVVLLLVVVLKVAPSARRFARANAALRSGVTQQGTALRALVNPRPPGDV